MKFMLVLMGLALTTLVPASRAQSGTYAVRWSTIDGGGGAGSAGSGGCFVVAGTVGQPDTGALSGSTLTVNGGFWSGVTNRLAGSLPALSIRRGSGHTIVLSWPHPCTGNVLQKSTDLNAPGGGWADVNPTPVVVGPNQEVTLPATGGFCLFRLRKL